jgi:hypothetical protein
MPDPECIGLNGTVSVIKKDIRMLIMPSFAQGILPDCEQILSAVREDASQAKR